jgi:flagellar hook-associated protein 2
MGRISTGIGLVSGINSKDIIDQLMALEARPKDTLQKRIDSANEQKLAYADLRLKLTSLKLFGTNVKKPSTFQAAATSSSNENVLTATAANGAAVGSFQLQVARLVTSQQSVSRGFADADSARIGAGTITIEQGGGELTQENPLADLRGGSGVRRGLFRISDRSGATAVIDTTAAVTLQDVVKKINNSLSISVRASIEEDRLVLTDMSGSTSSNLIVMDLGDGHSAADLGIAGSSGTNSLAGTDINFLGERTSLTTLNDGRGIRTAPTGADFRIQLSSGATHDVTLAGKKTIGELLDTINALDPTAVKAELVPGGNGIRITDLTGSGGMTVAALNGSKAAADLGLESSGTAVLNGSSLLASLDTVLISSLNGGKGLSLGSLSIKSRAAGAAATVNLAGAKTIKDLLKIINETPGIGVRASLNPSGNGIAITDISGGSGNLVIAEVGGGTTAGDLGLVANVAATAVNGTNLQRQWVSESTLLKTLNGGKGIPPGKFKITNSNGVSATIDLTQGNEIRVQHVLAEINSRGIGIVARINDNGDGILLEDTTAGPFKMKVQDTDGTAAKDLQIAGEAVTNSIDGTYERTITVTATDTLTTLQTKINDLNFGVTANIINDGSGDAPFRLSLNARNSGRSGRVVIDAGTTKLDFRNLVESQDAAVFLGGAGSADPLLVTASSNQIGGVIRGVTLDLHGVSDQPVTLNVSRSINGVIDEVNKFSDNFNGFIDKVKELTKFDTETNKRGLLLGNSSMQNIEMEVYAMLNTVVAQGGQFRVLADVGLKLGDGGRIEFDEEKFREAYAADPDAVQALFTTPENGLSAATPLSQLSAGRGIRTAPGGGTDFSIKLRDDTTLNIALSEAGTIGEILSAINVAGGGKIEATLLPTGAIRLTDLTTGTGSFTVANAGSSQALVDLGLNRTAVDGVITGRTLGNVPDLRQRGGGIGYAIENRITRLTDPVNGVITRENKTLDERTYQFESRIKSLDKLLIAKRERLERQFAQMESVLSNLQSQQQALSQIQQMRPMQSQSNR